MNKKDIIKRLGNSHFVTKTNRKYIVRKKSNNKLVGVIEFYFNYPHLTFTNGSLEVLFEKWGVQIPNIEKTTNELF